MKAAVLLIGWLIAAVAIVWWPTRPTGFNARWVAMPAAMSWDMISKAR
jgi:hypothetical protein